MSSTGSETAPARPARWRALIALFGMAMFVLGVGIGGLGLPRLLALNPDVTPQASVVAQVPLATATATSGAATTVASAAVTATAAPPTATVPPPTATIAPTATTPAPTATSPATATATATATVPPTPTATPTVSSGAIFAPDPQATATTTTTATTPTAARTGTPQATAPATAAISATATIAVPATVGPTATPTSPAFVATDRINTELPVNFRAGPGTTFAAQTTLPPGTLLAATGETQTVDGVVWQQFRIANGTIGWVRAQDVISVR